MDATTRLRALHTRIGATTAAIRLPAGQPWRADRADRRQANAASARSTLVLARWVR